VGLKTGQLSHPRIGIPDQVVDIGQEQTLAEVFDNPAKAGFTMAQSLLRAFHHR
jgi:hypothetical protein